MKKREKKRFLEKKHELKKPNSNSIENALNVFNSDFHDDEDNYFVDINTFSFFFHKNLHMRKQESDWQVMWRGMGAGSVYGVVLAMRAGSGKGISSGLGTCSK